MSTQIPKFKNLTTKPNLLTFIGKTPFLKNSVVVPIVRFPILITFAANFQKTRSNLGFVPKDNLGKRPLVCRQNRLPKITTLELDIR